MAFALFMTSNKTANIFVEGIYNYSSDVKSPNREYTIGLNYYDQHFNDGNYNVVYKKAFISRESVNGM